MACCHNPTRRYNIGEKIIWKNQKERVLDSECGIGKKRKEQLPLVIFTKYIINVKDYMPMRNNPTLGFLGVTAK